MAQAGATPTRITQADGVVVDGDLAIPDAATGLVVFAHGSGSSRHSRRNRHVATSLRERGLATLLMDLLTPEEDAIDAQTGEFRFDIELLARRLAGAADWLASEPTTAHLRLGYFGASTGAAAALVAAARGGRAAAVVSRGGRPDLAGGDALHAVHAPTLLIVGELDRQVIELNEVAEARMSAERQLVIVPGATHLFEEPGALDQVAELAGNWFVRHLSG